VPDPVIDEMSSVQLKGALGSRPELANGGIRFGGSGGIRHGCSMLARGIGIRRPTAFTRFGFGSPWFQQSCHELEGTVCFEGSGWHALGQGELSWKQTLSQHRHLGFFARSFQHLFASFARTFPKKCHTISI
jgi:hypothetical protein